MSRGESSLHSRLQGLGAGSDLIEAMKRLQALRGGCIQGRQTRSGLCQERVQGRAPEVVPSGRSGSQKSGDAWVSDDLFVLDHPRGDVRRETDSHLAGEVTRVSRQPFRSAVATIGGRDQGLQRLVAARACEGCESRLPGARLMIVLCGALREIG